MAGLLMAGLLVSIRAPFNLCALIHGQFSRSKLTIYVVGSIAVSLPGTSIESVLFDIEAHHRRCCGLGDPSNLASADRSVGIYGPA